MPPLDGPKDKPKKNREDQEVDYLMCSQCGTPCYVFEMEGDRIQEAMCLTLRQRRDLALQHRGGRT